MFFLHFYYGSMYVKFMKLVMHALAKLITIQNVKKKLEG